MEREKIEAHVHVEARVDVHHHFHFPRPVASQILIFGGTMGLSITAGAAALLVQLIPLPAGSVFDSPANLALTCDDADVVIAPAAGDTTGTMFDVSAPATAAANPSANLNATGLAGGVKITGTAPLAVQAAAPPQPATSIGIVPAANQPPQANPVTVGASGAVKGRAPAAK